MSDIVAQLQVLSQESGCLIDLSAIVDLSVCPKIDIKTTKPHKVEQKEDYVCITPSEQPSALTKRCDKKTCYEVQDEVCNKSTVILDLQIMVILGLITEVELEAYLKTTGDLHKDGKLNMGPGDKCKIDPLLSVTAGEHGSLLDLEVLGPDGLLDLDINRKDFLNVGGKGGLLDIAALQPRGQRLVDVDVLTQKDKKPAPIDVDVLTHSRRSNDRIADADVISQKECDEAMVDADVITKGNCNAKGGNNGSNGGNLPNKPTVPTAPTAPTTPGGNNGNNGGNNGGNTGNNGGNPGNGGNGSSNPTNPTTPTTPGGNNGSNGGNTGVVTPKKPCKACAGGKDGLITHYQPICKKGFKKVHSDAAEKCHAKDVNHCLAICNSKSALATVQANVQVGDIANIMLCAAIEFDQSEEGDNCRFHIAPETEPTQDDQLEEKPNCVSFVRN